jgi:ipoprotein LpqH
VRRELKKSILGAAAAILVIGAAAGCSSNDGAAPIHTGALVPGTAEITINGQNLGRFESVQCVPAGTLMTISTGDQNSGTTTLVSNADKLTAASVALNDIGGFTGSYNQGLGGTAAVTMIGSTYSITGSADGFATDNPSFRKSGDFTIKVAC